MTSTKPKATQKATRKKSSSSRAGKTSLKAKKTSLKAKKSAAGPKKPVQSRSKQTRDAILQASSMVLVQDGILGFNTNRVAELAGVSIGSLYQYFPNKQEILRELVNQALDRRLEHFRSRISPTILMLPPREAIATLIGAVMDGGAEDTELERVLIQQAPLFVGSGRFDENDAKMMPFVVATVQGVLKLRRIRVRKKNLELAFYVVFQAIRGVVAISHGHGFKSYSRDVLVEELTDLVDRYLLSSDSEA